MTGHVPPVRPDVFTAFIPTDAQIKWSAVRRPYGPPQQFAAGRRAAGAALAASGASDLVVPRHPDGRPRFPRGFAGSIAHTGRWAIAVVTRGAVAVGIDIESGVISPRVARFILCERERRILLPPGGNYAPRDLFAAKEAAFKALCNIEKLNDLLFWRIELRQSDDAIIASYRGMSVPVWIHSGQDISLALAISL